MSLLRVEIFLLGILVATFGLVIAKRVAALISGFALQSLFLFLMALSLAISSAEPALYAVAALVLGLKVVLIPYMLRRIVRKIQVNENVVFFINPLLSLLSALGVAYLAYYFVYKVLPPSISIPRPEFVMALTVTMLGLFIMVFRMKAISQIIGLLVMENGVFLAATAIAGGMPFFVEIAIFFDVFVCVIILGIFVYRINRTFTHIDVHKMTTLKG